MGRGIVKGVWGRERWTVRREGDRGRGEEGEGAERFVMNSSSEISGSEMLEVQLMLQFGNSLI
jgi:hypothetical protein